MIKSCLVSPYKDANPNPIKTSGSLNYFLTCLTSKNSHAKCYSFNIWILRGHSSVHSKDGEYNDNSKGSICSDPRRLKGRLNTTFKTKGRNLEKLTTHCCLTSFS